MEFILSKQCWIEAAPGLTPISIRKRGKLGNDIEMASPRQLAKVPNEPELRSFKSEAEAMLKSDYAEGDDLKHVWQEKEVSDERETR
jgi:hypothetical protein